MKPISYAPYQIVGCLFHGHVAYAHHAYRNHSGLDLVILFLFACLFEFFPFGIVHTASKGDLIYKLFDYQDYPLTNFCVLLYVNTPRQNDHIESFHKMLKKEYVWPHEFGDAEQAEARGP